MKVLLVVGDAGRDAPADVAFARDLAAHGWDVEFLRARNDRATADSSMPTASARLELQPGGATLVRTDAAPHHWQRTRSGAVARLVRDHVAARTPDVVHVLAWRGTSHDIVAACAEVSVPCVVTLTDAWFGCLVGDRVQRADGEDCAEPLGPSPCLACAELEFGATPWVPIEARFLAVAARRRDTLRELGLARRVLVADETAADAARHALSDSLANVAFVVVDDPRDAAAHARVYAAAAAERARLPAPKPAEWFTERMQDEAERAWDQSRWTRASEERA